MNTIARVVADAARTLSGVIAHHGDVGVPRAASFDLQRYYGSWHVIEAIPLAPEREAVGPLESYSPGEKAGEIAIEYRFHKKASDGPIETKHMVAEIKAGTGDAEWGVKVLGLHAQYVISFVEPDYSAVIVARDARDHVWIMSRAPTLDPGRLETYRAMVTDMGYDTSRLFSFPQIAAP